MHADEHGGQLTLADVAHELPRGASELAITLADPSVQELALAAGPGVRLRALVVVPELPELPPPPKLPWEPEAEPEAEPETQPELSP